jgi:hypothetical protein
MVTFAVFLCSLGVGEGAEGFDDNTLSLAFSLQWQKISSGPSNKIIFSSIKGGAFGKVECLFFSSFFLAGPLGIKGKTFSKINK